jgi:hypothetical protein
MVKGEYMNRFNYDTLQYLKEGNNPNSATSIFEIEMNCDHKYPDGESAAEGMLWSNSCKICNRVVNNSEKAEINNER